MLAAKPQLRDDPPAAADMTLLRQRAPVSLSRMKRMLVTALLLLPAATAAHATAPLYDPVSLNIGLACQWQQRCIGQQQRAMKRALKYVKKYKPPSWRIHLCNRNAARKRGRIDWIGFDRCVRNVALRPPPPPPPPPPKRRKRAR